MRKNIEPFDPLSMGKGPITKYYKVYNYLNFTCAAQPVSNSEKRTSG